jgi:hypothetical protein
MTYESLAPEDPRSDIFPSWPASHEVHERLDGRYRLRRLLAKSAGALIYAADHVFTHRPVAVKVPRPGCNRGGALAQFRREAEALALVRGPGIVELLDAGLTGGLPYIVLELLEGRTLAGLVTARGRLASADAVTLGIQLARALERCHERGVLHLDVKPGNLFVTSAAGCKLRLLDFGIARLPDDERTQTEDACVRGTPEYMAPEALVSMPIDQRADIYGFGVTLYECLTGTVPHEGSYEDVLRKVSSGTAETLDAALREIPATLGAILGRCLARDPDDRFASAGELRRALEAQRSKAAESEGAQGAAAGAERRRQQPDTIADGPAAKQDRRSSSRRKHARAPYTTLARITQPSGAVLDGRLEEVSEGGLQFIGDHEVPGGQTVRIRFALPATGRVTEVGAIARWSRGARGSHATGFEFSEIADPARAELRQYARIMCPSAAPN